MTSQPSPKIRRVNLTEAKREYEKKIAELLGKEFKTDATKSNAERRRELRAALKKKLRKDPKYNNHPTEVIHNGEKYCFDSKLEAGHFRELCLRELAGEIKDIKCQDSVYLTEARIHFVVDFSYWHIKNRRKEYFESKGLELERFRIQKKLWPYYGDGPITIDFGGGRQEVIHPKGIKRKCSLCGK